MSDESQDTGVVESQEAVEAEATHEPEELTTLKKRLAGKDQAYTKLKAEAEALRAEREALSRWKAEREESDLSEVEKLQKRLAEAEERATAVEAEKERIRLQSSYPLAVEFYGDDPLPSEDRLAALQKRLGTTAATEQVESDVDPNTPPRRSTGVTAPEPTIEELKANLRREASKYDSLEQMGSWAG